MDQMHGGLLHAFLFLVAGSNPLAYIVLFVAALILGNILSFTVLWFAFHHRLGDHPLGLLILTLFVAHIAGNITAYLCGRLLKHTRLGKWLHDKYISKYEKVERSIRTHCLRWMFIAEFLAYSSFPLLFLIGWMQVKFRDFLKASFVAIGTSFALLLIITSALASSLGFLHAKAIFKHLEILFALGLVAFFILHYCITRIIRRYFKLEAEHVE